MQPIATTPALRTLRLLLVDDDALLLNTLHDVLRSEGHSIVPAVGGQAGIDAFRLACSRNETFDAVITDLGMPYIDGRKVATAVKSLSATTPVILLTGWGQRFIVANETPAHVDKVLSKPPRLSDLRTSLMELTA
jgi:DNA-binding response OmpR family regulator